MQAGLTLRQATFRVDLRRGLSPVLWTWLGSRLFVTVVAVVAARLAPRTRSERLLDAPSLTNPFGHTGLGRLLSPLARWDAVHYLNIVHNGYGHTGPRDVRTAFFTLYPLVVNVASGFDASARAALAASWAVSLAAFVGALYLLWRLVELDLGSKVATRTVVLLALFPTSFFFSAPYAESLFLLLSVAAFYAARTGHWAWTGVLAAVASAERPPGVLLAVPLVLIYLYGPRADRPPAVAADRGESWRDRLRPRHALRPDVLWIGLAPLGLVAYTAYLGIAIGEPLAWAHVETNSYMYRLIWPFTGFWNGVEAAGDGIGQLSQGTHAVLAQARVLGLVALLLGAVATVGALRRLPIAYGVYPLMALALALTTQLRPEPLRSLPLYLVVVFPLFMWLAIVCERKLVRVPVLALWIAGLGVLTAQFASWRWIA